MQTFASQVSSILFVSDTIICNNILLYSAKYIIDYFLSITPLRLWGSVGVINGLLPYMVRLHKLLERT